MTSTTGTTTRYLDVTGGRIAYDDAPGAGVPVVLLPGMLDQRAVYRHLVPLLSAAGHRVVTMDLRGMGESSTGFTDHTPAAIAGDLAALLAHLDLRGAVLVGSSYTGATVVRAAALAPERTGGVVLIDAFVENLPLNGFQKALFGLAAPLVSTFPGLWGALQKFYYPAGARPADFDAYRAGLSAMLREPGRKAALRGYLKGDSAPVGWCAAVDVPALVLMGGKDPDFPAPELVADRQAAALRGRKVMIGGAGHYPMAGRPQAVADALLPFLAERAGAHGDDKAAR
ncbi:MULTISPECIES: alpha/beta hydrolase [Kitasatospora]|uniref:Putative peptidase S33 family protein n=1 Tax=Kitasatospora setae (strain ATCC 33774 / DSM 43861 / JCM 3304 / KCC A-0304 / NBRC 14216 / KM-6054) TaxID=452652 RepID=E4MZY7_KITSK|nr:MULTISPECIES: alpha/beta hydrolase [Kitasatospora]BAJ30071.1 putative peptidase S33 family protein [Kitasatospora setae KM-6054]